MKKLLLILLCLPFIGFGQNVYIPDPYFKAYLVGNTAINTNGDSEIQVSEAIVFNGSLNCFNLNIYDLTGVEAFTAIPIINCSDNLLTSLDVSQNTALTTLYCNYNQITSLDVSNNTALIFLNCDDNQLTSLDVSNNPALELLHCGSSGSNQITSLDVSNNTALTTLWCGNNQLTSLDVSNNTALTSLQCFYNQLTTLDVSTNTALTLLSCWNNQLTSLDVSQNTALNTLWCGNNQLTSLDVRNGNNTNLTGLSLNITNNPNLFCIDVDDVVWSTTNWTVANGNMIDSTMYFSTNCSGTTSIQEHTTNKELLKVTDLLGRETKGTNQPLLYLYDDGTVEKRIVIE